MDVLLGKEIQVSVNPELQTTSDTARWRFSPEERGCYFEGELRLDHLDSEGPRGYRYSLANCLYSRAVSAVIESCSCVPHLNLSQDRLHNLPVCQETSLLCMNTILRAASSSGQEDGLCMAACEDQVLDMEVTSSTFPNKANFRKREEQCLLLSKLRLLCSDHRKVTVSQAYPGLCTNVSQTYGRCEGEASTNSWQESVLEHQLFRYARDNLVVVNIYIKVSQTVGVYAY